MARILYAIGGEGRGHAARVLAMTETLRARGHEVTFAGGGQARAFLDAHGETVLAVPALRQVLDGNRLRLTRTALANASTVLGARRLVAKLARQLERIAPDLVVSDFEAFVPRAAARVGIPVVSFNNQEVLTEGIYRLPERLRASAALAETAVRAIAPPAPTHRIVTALTALPLRHPARTTLVGPILRRAVREAVPHGGAHLVAYFNVERRLDPILRALEGTGVPVHLYGVGAEGMRGNLTFRPFSNEAFLEDLATCRGVVTTAGFTLLSESLFLGKPVLALPNGSVFEQTFNARLLEDIGAGHAVHDRSLNASDVRRFLDAYDGRPVGHAPVMAPGHEMASRVLECYATVPATAPIRVSSLAEVPSLSGLVPAAVQYFARRSAQL
ncbi:MAG TPA: glycosyltransferase family protein [Rhodothermales bacterium]|nr:glycosyltransferase family protein [Rhodothermales bacterium]